MKKTLAIALMVLATSCATPHKKDSRKVASEDLVSFASNRDISGQFLGVAQYAKGRKEGPEKAAARIYFQELAGEKGKYNAVLLEYVNLLKIAPKYVASNKLKFIANKTGYLNSITQNISTYRVEPTADVGVFEMYPLVVVGDQIEVKRDAKPRILTLSKDEGAQALSGATISQSREDEPKEIFFPSQGDEGNEKKTGAQYKIAKLTYEKAKLDSTWRKSYLTGPYLAQYAKKNDVVLTMASAGDVHTAKFLINEEEAAKVSREKRIKVFTSPKSAFLKGDFTVTEPQDGMFLFTADSSADAETKSIVEGRIGLFIDVFDATKSLNQDVVEFVLIDTSNPQDFLMYYEHPDNGEGTSSARE